MYNVVFTNLNSENLFEKWKTWHYLYVQLFNLEYLVTLDNSRLNSAL